MKSGILVTGGAGFIGSNFVRTLLASPVVDARVPIVVVDNLSYAGHLATISDIIVQPRVSFVQTSIENREDIANLLKQYAVRWVVNFAAESHVDKSIDSPKPFMMTNVVGTLELLEACRHYMRELSVDDKNSFRYLQISTDEVFGALGPEGSFNEYSPFLPNSPYSASKASADHWVRAYHRTYGLNTLTTHCSNNFGPYQFPEKLIPVVIQKALRSLPIPVYGEGKQVRDWLYVSDHCEAVLRVLTHAEPGSRYLIGGGTEMSNIDLVMHICSVLDKKRPRTDGLSYAAQIVYVQDRPGHDFRYSIDPQKISEDLGWKPNYEFSAAMQNTVQWYLDNSTWCDQVLGTEDGLKRQGLG